MIRLRHSKQGRRFWLRQSCFGGPWIRACVLACVLVCGAQTGKAAENDSANIKVLIVTGVDYPGHHWRQTWPVLAAALREDPRIEVFTIEDPHFLDSAALSRYAAAVMHWQNWEQPGPGAKARSNLQGFIERGGGVALVHFACGAWHGEWEGYRQVAGRVWFGQGAGKVQHDPYGPFLVKLTRSEHPVIQGMDDFETTDELYTCLIGDHPIEILAEAESKVTGQVHPMAFVSRLGKGRTFHCTLGHDVKALSVPEVRMLYRRGIAWAAGLEVEQVE
jgi:type 1 glutamine amidotransferase